MTIMLQQLLKQDPSRGQVQLLNLNRTPAENGMPPEEFHQVCTLLNTCTDLKGLVLDNCNLGPEQILALAGALRNCKELTSLSLQGNQIDAAGLASLASVLSRCSKLNMLDLRNNPLGDAGMITLFNALDGPLNLCKSLKWVHFGVNEEGVKQFGYLGKMELQDDTIRQLYTRIDEGSARYGVGRIMYFHEYFKELAATLPPSYEAPSQALGAAPAYQELATTPVLAQTLAPTLRQATCPGATPALVAACVAAGVAGLAVVVSNAL